MIRTTGNQKISIILVLSISTVTTLLVTGTVVNIVSAAGSINVQTKTNQHPVTSKGSPHIVSSVAHGTNVQPKTKTRLYSQCYMFEMGGMNPTWGPCPAKFSYISIRPNSYVVHGWVYGGTLLGWRGQLPTEYAGKPSTLGTWKELGNAGILIKVQQGKDKHAWYEPGVVTKTDASGRFGGEFSLCDDPKYSSNDHNAYLTAYLDMNGQRAVELGPPDPGPYTPAESTAELFTLKVCNPTFPTDFTDMKIEPYPSNDTMYYPNSFPFSGKLEGLQEGKKIGISEAALHYSLRYLDDTTTGGKGPGPHPFQLGSPNLPRETNEDGTFDGHVNACDDPRYRDYNHDAQMNIHFDGGTVSSQGPFTGATSSNMLFHVPICSAAHK